MEGGVGKASMSYKVPCVSFVDLLAHHGFFSYTLSSGVSCRFRWRDWFYCSCASFPAKCLAEKGVKPYT